MVNLELFLSCHTNLHMYNTFEGHEHLQYISIRTLGNVNILISNVCHHPQCKYVAVSCVPPEFLSLVVIHILPNRPDKLDTAVFCVLLLAVSSVCHILELSWIAILKTFPLNYIPLNAHWSHCLIEMGSSATLVGTPQFRTVRMYYMFTSQLPLWPDMSMEHCTSQGSLVKSFC